MFIEVSRTSELNQAKRDRIVEICNAAFPESFDRLFSFLSPMSMHVIGRDDNGKSVSHAVVTERMFLIGNWPKMKAAYVDAVATAPDYQEQGFAGKVMRELIQTVSHDFDIAGLSTFIPDFYARLGWEPWTGPLSLETEHGLKPTPEEKGVMIHRLPQTGEIDLDEPLTANWRPGGGW